MIGRNVVRSAVYVILALVGWSVWASGGSDGSEAMDSSVTVVATGRYNEAPMLAQEVAVGNLPPLEERLPHEPSVVEAPEIGQYSDTIRVFAVNRWTSFNDLLLMGRYLLKVGAEGGISGDIALGFDYDTNSVTIYLRPGMRWSDGTLFTADDFVFRFEGLRQALEHGAHPTVQRVVKIDDYTVRLETDDAPHRVALTMATWQGREGMMFVPKNYLSKWHIEYDPDADARAKEEGYDSWSSALDDHFHEWWQLGNDPEVPTLNPWQSTEIERTWRIMERNPFYWQLDPVWNQLPYFDRVVSELVDKKETYLLRVLSGEADLAYRLIRYADYSIFKNNETSGDYTVVTIPSATSLGIALNLNHKDDEKRELYEDVRFRRALSLAINREDVNQRFYYGLAEPYQSAPPETVSYYNKEWAEKYAVYDPGRANVLLDEIGIATRDDDGFRLSKRGDQIKISVQYLKDTLQDERLLQLIQSYWNDIGIRVDYNVVQQEQWNLRRRWGADSPHHDSVAGMLTSGDEVAVFLQGARHHTCYRSQSPTKTWGPCGDGFNWGFDWGKWLADHGSGIEPPQEIKDLHRYTLDWTKTRYASDDYSRLARQIYDLQADNLWIIGVVGLISDLYIVKNGIRNVPIAYPNGTEEMSSLGYLAATLFRLQ